MTQEIRAEKLKSCGYRNEEEIEQQRETDITFTNGKE